MIVCSERFLENLNNTLKDAFVEFEVLQDNLFVTCSNRTGNSYNKVMLSYEDIERIKKFLDKWDD